MVVCDLEGLGSSSRKSNFLHAPSNSYYYCRRHTEYSAFDGELICGDYSRRVHHDLMHALLLRFAESPLEWIHRGVPPCGSNDSDTPSGQMSALGVQTCPKHHQACCVRLHQEIIHRELALALGLLARVISIDQVTDDDASVGLARHEIQRSDKTKPCRAHLQQQSSAQPMPPHVFVESHAKWTLSSSPCKRQRSG